MLKSSTRIDDKTQRDMCIKGNHSHTCGIIFNGSATITIGAEVYNTANSSIPALLRYILRPLLNFLQWNSQHDPSSQRSCQHYKMEAA